MVHWHRALSCLILGYHPKKSPGLEGVNQVHRQVDYWPFAGCQMFHGKQYPWVSLLLGYGKHPLIAMPISREASYFAICLGFEKALGVVAGKGGVKMSNASVAAVGLDWMHVMARLRDTSWMTAQTWQGHDPSTQHEHFGQEKAECDHGDHQGHRHVKLYNRVCGATG